VQSAEVDSVLPADPEAPSVAVPNATRHARKPRRSTPWNQGRNRSSHRNSRPTTGRSCQPPSITRARTLRATVCAMAAGPRAPTPALAIALRCTHRAQPGHSRTSGWAPRCTSDSSGKSQHQQRRTSSSVVSACSVIPQSLRRARTGRNHGGPVNGGHAHGHALGCVVASLEVVRPPARWRTRRAGSRVWIALAYWVTKTGSRCGVGRPVCGRPSRASLDAALARHQRTQCGCWPPGTKPAGSRRTWRPTCRWWQGSPSTCQDRPGKWCPWISSSTKPILTRKGQRRARASA